ncbi:hypothetical protein C8R46DRAFT_1206025 [Mycena filopes]|nr:hypothetical protein C8R46DRAFT_1206025 [Mycena filopes]
MLPLLPFLVLAALAAHTRGDDTVSVVDGKHVPSTTDFPAPETTDDGSTIASAYEAYIEECGLVLQQANAQAVDEYKYEFGSDPADSNSPAFIVWAYNHFLAYEGQYDTCQSEEKKYQSLLATFIPETPSPTSHTGTSPTGTGGFSFTTSSSHSESGGSGVGGGSDGGNTNGANSVAASFIRPLVGLLVVVAGCLVG